MDYEAEYNTRLRVPEYREIFARWHAAAAAARSAVRTSLDQPYGPGERQRYDLFHAGPSSAPLIVYLHGGYWQVGTRKDTAFVADAFNAAGIDVAIPSYSLCPDVSVMQIVDELRGCLAALWQRTGTYPVVVGHSAGGHLAAAMLASDWSRVPGAPADLVRTGCTLSGLFELAPLIPTSINAAIGLDATTAVDASPLSWPPPPPGRTLIAAVGSDESSEFHRQSRAIAQAWAAAGVHTEYVAVAGANHYTLLDELTRPGGALFGRIASLVTQQPGANHDER